MNTNTSTTHRRETLPRLFVGNLDKNNVSNSDLFKLASDCVDGVVAAKVVHDSVGKCYGFVEFSNQDSADEAQVLLNGREFHGRRLYVAPATGRKR